MDIILAIVCLVFLPMAFFSGWCFGKAEGMRVTMKDWEHHMKEYVDPLVAELKEQIKFYKSKHQ